MQAEAEMMRTIAEKEEEGDKIVTPQYKAAGFYPAAFLYPYFRLLNKKTRFSGVLVRFVFCTMLA